MIEVKAESVTKDGEKGVQLTCSLEGAGDEIVNEALISIRAIIGGVKEESLVLYTMLIAAMAEDQSILRGERGEDKEEDEAMLGLAEAMSRGIILKKGVN